MLFNWTEYEQLFSLRVEGEIQVIRGGGKQYIKVYSTLVYFELIRSRWTQIIAQGPNVTKKYSLSTHFDVEV